LLEAKSRLPILKLTEIHHVMELHPFFYTLVEQERHRSRGEERSSHLEDNASLSSLNDRTRRGSQSFQKDLEADIDKLIEADFIEPICS
jgi:hypothetical protein